MGNIVNRVFDSSGPEGKVRGTPQQIIDKYNQLARDAQLGNDRVAAENFQQHSEHYTRLLSEAQREQNERREQQEREQEARREQQGERRDRDRNQGQHRNDAQPAQNDADKPPEAQEQPDVTPSADVIDVSADTDADAGLVETPESAPPKPRRGRKPKAQQQPQADGSAPPQEAAE